MSDFPGNSFAGKGEPDPAENAQDEKKIKQVTAEAARTRKPGLGKKFKGVFFGGDAKTAGNYVIFDVLIPAAKDTMVEGVSQLMERVVFGESRRNRRGHGAPPPSAGPTGYVSYNRYAMQQQEQPRSMTRRARASHDFDEIILNSRQEAEDVIEKMFDIISRYESASVADLYELVGLPSVHTDQKWGWLNIQGSRASRLRGGGYLLDLPQPIALQ
jgi:hypothetical protein